MISSELDTKYNYILVGKVLDLYAYAYRQINELDYACFDDSFTKNKLCYSLERAYWSTKINSILPLPFKKKWVKAKIKKLKKIYQTIPQKQENLCFLLFSLCIPWEKYGFSKLLKETFPGCHIIYYLGDLVDANPIRREFIQQSHPEIDLIYTYDPGDAKKYHLIYHEFPYSDLSKTLPSASPDCDICFIGQAKNRLNDILQAYAVLRDKGFRCSFYVVNSKRQQRLFQKEIHYCRWISYRKYLQIINNSKVILDISQKGSQGHSVRMNEAIMFQKILLSNNPALKNDSLYNENYMLVYNDINEVNLSILEKKVYYQNTKDLLPIHFLNTIAHDLENLNLSLR